MPLCDKKEDGDDEGSCGTEEAEGAKTSLQHTEESLGSDMKRALAEKGSGNRKFLKIWGILRFCSMYVGTYDNILEYASLNMWEFE